MATITMAAMAALGVRPPALAMQKVVGSSPIIRSSTKPRNGAFSLAAPGKRSSALDHLTYRFTEIRPLEAPNDGQMTSI